MNRKKIRFGLIGLGLMGREFASAAARWCNLLDEDLPVPELVGICDQNPAVHEWFKRNFPGIKIIATDYKDLLASREIDAIYCAVPHNLHEKLYTDIIRAKKHLLGEKPFGLDKAANDNIMHAIQENPGVIVRCSSEFPYFPGAQKLIQWIKEKKYGRLIEVRSGFHHSSDLDLAKPINWKRIKALNGESGCMGDLGMHTHHIPLRLGWVPKTVFADLQKIAETRPDGKGNQVACETWDNATLTCRCINNDNQKPFTLVLETKRMAPGATNTWFLEVYGTEGSAKFSTQDPKAFHYSQAAGSSQAWCRLDLGTAPLAFPVITGAIFEFGFSDCFQQMIAAFVNELSANKREAFGCVTPEETALSHKILSAALESHKTNKKIPVRTSPGQLCMLWPAAKPVPAWKMPAGYSLRTFQEGDQAGYVALMRLAGFADFDDNTVAEVLKSSLPAGLFFVVHDATGKIVATTVANHQPSALHPAGGELGWVAGDPGHKGQGLGKITCAAVTKRFLEAGYRRIYLYTDDWRLPAIKTYLNLGWVPLLYQDDMRGRWQKVCADLNWPANESNWVTL